MTTTPTKIDRAHARAWFEQHYDIEPLDDDEAEIERVAEALSFYRDKLVETFTDMGRDLMENGKALQEYDPGTRIEGRVRTHVGMFMLEFAQVMILDARAHPLDRAMEDLVDKVREAVKDDPEALALLDRLEEES